MYLSNLSVAQLRKLTSLLRQREKMEGRHARQKVELETRQALQIARVNGRIEKLGNRKKDGLSPRRKTAKRAARGALKKWIMDALVAAGTNGTSIPALSGQLKVTKKNLRSWFYNTGRKVNGLRRLKDGRYVYEVK